MLVRANEVKKGDVISWSEEAIAWFNENVIQLEPDEVEFYKTPRKVKASYPAGNLMVIGFGSAGGFTWHLQDGAPDKPFIKHN